MENRDDAGSRQADEEGDLDVTIFTIIKSDRIGEEKEKVVLLPLLGGRGLNTVYQTILAKEWLFQLFQGWS